MRQEKQKEKKNKREDEKMSFDAAKIFNHKTPKELWLHVQPDWDPTIKAKSKNAHVEILAYFKNLQEVKINPEYFNTARLIVQL